MTINEFTRTFNELSCRPKKQYGIRVYKRGSNTSLPERCLGQGYLGGAIWTQEHNLGDATVVSWHIHFSTIMMIVDPVKGENND